MMSEVPVVFDMEMASRALRCLWGVTYGRDNKVWLKDQRPESEVSRLVMAVTTQLGLRPDMYAAVVFKALANGMRESDLGTWQKGKVESEWWNRVNLKLIGEGLRSPDCPALQLGEVIGVAVGLLDRQFCDFLQTGWELGRLEGLPAHALVGGEPEPIKRKPYTHKKVERAPTDDQMKDQKVLAAVLKKKTIRYLRGEEVWRGIKTVKKGRIVLLKVDQRDEFVVMSKRYKVIADEGQISDFMDKVKELGMDKGKFKKLADRAQRLMRLVLEKSKWMPQLSQKELTYILMWFEEQGEPLDLAMVKRYSGGIGFGEIEKIIKKLNAKLKRAKVGIKIEVDSSIL